MKKVNDINFQGFAEFCQIIKKQFSPYHISVYWDNDNGYYVRINVIPYEIEVGEITLGIYPYALTPPPYRDFDFDTENKTMMLALVVNSGLYPELSIKLETEQKSFDNNSFTEGLKKLIGQTFPPCKAKLDDTWIQESEEWLKNLIKDSSIAADCELIK